MLAPLRMSVLLLLLCGGIYPAAVTLFGQVLFHHQAQGSLMRSSGGAVIGSDLIGQAFDKPIYFHPRPSSAGPNGYDAQASGGSNLGPTNRALIEHVKARAQALRGENPSLKKLPADLLTSSGSGLDPDISPAAALAQVPMVAKARGRPASELTALVRREIIGPDLGIFGQARVNVLRLNMALDALKK